MKTYSTILTLFLLFTLTMYSQRNIYLSHDDGREMKVRGFVGVGDWDRDIGLHHDTFPKFDFFEYERKMMALYAINCFDSTASKTDTVFIDSQSLSFPYSVPKFRILTPKDLPKYPDPKSKKYSNRPIPYTIYSDKTKKARNKEPKVVWRSGNSSIVNYQ